MDTFAGSTKTRLVIGSLIVGSLAVPFVGRAQKEDMQQCIAELKESTEWRFQNHEELSTKLAPQGSVALTRISKYAKERDIVIPMDCLLALL